MATIDYQYIADRIPADILEPLMRSDDVDDINMTLIDEFISDADAEIDNALALKYQFPYVKTDEVLGEKTYSLIKRWKFIIVRQLIYSRKYDDEEMKEVNNQHKAILNRLAIIRKGEEELLGIAKKSSAVRTPSTLIKVKKNTPIFTNENLRNNDPTT